MREGWLLFLPAAVFTMTTGLIVVLRQVAHGATCRQRYAVATTGCRLASASGLLLAPTGLYWVAGGAWTAGAAVMLVGLLTAVTAHATVRRFASRCR